ncbi:MAG: hypothetical protein AMXMBFR53_41920 [Gemmatimonadota bacterium]
MVWRQLLAEEKQGLLELDWLSDRSVAGGDRQERPIAAVHAAPRKGAGSRRHRKSTVGPPAETRLVLPRVRSLVDPARAGGWAPPRRGENDAAPPRTLEGEGGYPEKTPPPRVATR